jgi:Ankyrin repeats (3 copies)
MGQQRRDPAAVASPRIPVALQHVFLASNRGEEVDVAPENGIAFRLFRRVRNTMVENTKSLPREQKRQNTMNTSCSETVGKHSANTSSNNNNNNNNKRFRLSRLYMKPTLSRPSTTTFGDLHVQNRRENVSNGTSKGTNGALRVLTFRRVRNEKPENKMVTQNRHNAKLVNDSKSQGNKNARNNKGGGIACLTNNKISRGDGISSEVSISNPVAESELSEKTYENEGPHSPSGVANFDEYDSEAMSCKVKIERCCRYFFLETFPFLICDVTMFSFPSSLNFFSKIPDHTATASMNPQSYLCSILSRRGYPTKTYDTLNSGYHNDSTPLQEASYTTYIVALVRDGKRKQLRKIFDCGIHPNPSNYYGESLIHLVSRLGSYETLKIMVDGGSSVQVCDDYGRTPLHDACWSNIPCLDVVTLLLKQDRHLLFMADCRGAVPLQYVSKENWAVWKEYIDSMVDDVFPVRPRSQGIIDHADEGAVLARMRPNTRPLVCRPNGLSMELIRLVATGRMEPEEIEVIRGMRGNNECDESISSDSSDSSSTSTADDDTLKILVSTMTNRRG